LLARDPPPPRARPVQRRLLVPPGGGTPRLRRPRTGSAGPRVCARGRAVGPDGVYRPVREAPRGRHRTGNAAPPGSAEGMGTAVRLVFPQGHRREMIGSRPFSGADVPPPPAPDPTSGAGGVRRRTT